MHSVQQTSSNLEQTQKDLPTQFLRSTSPLSASLVIASFGNTEGYYSEAFPLTVKVDSDTPIAAPEKPLRYGKQPEIHHVFRSDPKSPNILIVAVFTIAAVATLPVLLGLVSLQSSCSPAVHKTDNMRNSGFKSAATSPIYQRHFPTLQSLTASSSARSLALRVSSSSTTQPGTCSKPSLFCLC